MRLVFRVHAVARMFQHGIDEDDVRCVLDNGETIKSYPEDEPHPSRLVLGWSGSDPLHVVAADDVESGKTFIITVYKPDPELWEPDFRRKRS